ncbi:YbaY family lipoprotein [Chromohalobacter israelensis]|uniref:YbaY family lipoprotein n=1 Tax=Chromohalobacter israelensis TaxID=141390 RepID=UPI001CC462CB|nr:YbaY family lipoprotein [Chromohalobacter salexigens]MBZ5876267.1 YbaY family lipoprotein [Chromohalobacter salexigens]
MSLSRLSHRLRTALCGAFLAGLVGCASGPDFQTLDARVVFDTPPALSPAATLEVALKDSADDTTLAESRYPRIDTEATEVALRYDASAIDAAHRYTLQAEVRDQGRITYLNRDEVEVLNGDTGTTPTITLVPASRR